ncbi:MAG TPA: lytic transglycosylase domain-containing protein [Blastocatellia bacterium]|jgi:soluble lytic murein transglycosylase-like protein|nr:lytic transglycosylase domain-containing protein [Blastocatellia bacterium]
MAYSTAQIQQMLSSVAGRYGIDSAIAFAQINQESGFNPNARSSAGAQGLAQFIPGTWARFGSGSPFDPVQALEAWGKYMSFLLRMFNGRYDLALAGYNWGENRATLAKALAEGRPVTNYSIPAETRNYVTRILSAAGRSLPALAPAPAPAPGSPSGSTPGAAGAASIFANVPPIYLYAGGAVLLVALVK